MASNTKQGHKSPTTTLSDKDALDKLMYELSRKHNNQAVRIANNVCKLQMARGQPDAVQSEQNVPIGSTEKLAKDIGNALTVDKDIGNAAATAISNSLAIGAKQFEEKAGRPMTYSEMRAMWG